MAPMDLEIDVVHSYSNLNEVVDEFLDCLDDLSPYIDLVDHDDLSNS